jgi:phage shock protein C
MQNKKLHLSKHHKVIAGVCGGLAEYFETDPVLLRLIFLFFTFMGGAGVLVYLVAWMLMSDKKELDEIKEEIKMSPHHPDHHTQGILGYFLIILGVLLLMDNLFPGFGLRTFWPLLLVFLGLMIMLRKHREHPNE